MYRVWLLLLLCTLPFWSACIATETTLPLGLSVTAAGPDKYDSPEETIAHLTHVLLVDASAYEAWLARGEAYYQTGNYEAALADFNQALRLCPNDPFAYAGRGVVLKALGRYEEALQDFERAVSTVATVFDL
jgi:tetratricopeptide (TPR) repeat protein